MSFLTDFTNGLLKENPTFRLLIGMCPVLATSVAVTNGLGMGIAATFVLVGSNVIISLLRNFIPPRIRIPCFIVVIATFVTIVDLVMAAFTPGLHEVLGIFIPLIVVNCIILARAEAFASKRPVVNSLADGLGMGLGFTVAITLLSFIREFLGTGTVFSAPDFGFAGLAVFSGDLGPVIMLLPPGAFITLGLLIGLINLFTGRKS